VTAERLAGELGVVDPDELAAPLLHPAVDEHRVDGRDIPPYLTTAARSGPHNAVVTSSSASSTRSALLPTWIGPTSSWRPARAEQSGSTTRPRSSRHGSQRASAQRSRIGACRSGKEAARTVTILPFGSPPRLRSPRGACIRRASQWAAQAHCAESPSMQRDLRNQCGRNQPKRIGRS
jgi:hypothetical protein